MKSEDNSKAEKTVEQAMQTDVKTEVNPTEKQESAPAKLEQPVLTKPETNAEEKSEPTKKDIDIVKIVLFPFIFIVKVFIYICEGTYYTYRYTVLEPIDKLINLYYKLFTSKKIKKTELSVSLNFDENGEIKENPNNVEDVNTIMRKNKKSLSSLRKKKISKRTETKLDAERQSLLKMISEGQEKRLDKPTVFKYKALDHRGNLVSNIFFGVSKLDIYTFLTGEGYTVYSIEPSKFHNFIYGNKFVGFKKLKTKDLMFFLTQLSTYIKSGITLTESVRILSEQLKKDKSQSRIMQAIVYYLTMGESFSNALSRLGDTFPNLVINMIKAAEATGDLDVALDDLGNYYTEINKTKKDMISAISYPVLVLIFSVVIIGIIMVKIVPQFTGIYASAGAQLNPLTSFVIKTSAFVTANIFKMLIITFILIFIVFMAYKNVYPFRRAFQTMLMRLPVFGQIIISNEMTIFTKTFASLLKNDVFITDTIDILSKLTNNEIYKEIMVNTITNIAKGNRISDSFNDHWAVPSIAYHMIVTGENTGQLAEMMARVSAYYQEQHKALVGTLKSLIEPFMILFLAVIVGGVMIAVLMPMFGLYSNLLS